jgi:hypothetical protein
MSQQHSRRCTRLVVVIFIAGVFSVLDRNIDGTSTEKARSLLVPRFTIRTLLALLTVFAIVFVMIGTATRGQYWAWGVTIGLVSLIITALTHAAWFGIVWLFVHMAQGGAPISESTLRQVMAPSTPEIATATAAGKHLPHDGEPQA